MSRLVAIAFRRSFFKNGYRSIGRREPGLVAQAVVLALAIAQLVPPDSESGGGHYSDVVQLARRVTSGVVSLRSFEGYKLTTDTNRIAPFAIRSIAGPVLASSPKNPPPRRGGSNVSPAGRLSDPRQIVARAMYRMPQRTSSAPSPIRNILAAQFVAPTHVNAN